MNTLTNQTATEKAIQMVIMDIIEKGHTTVNEITSYMASEVFAAAVSTYKQMFLNF